MRKPDRQDAVGRRTDPNSRNSVRKKSGQRIPRHFCPEPALSSRGGGGAACKSSGDPLLERPASCPQGKGSGRRLERTRGRCSGSGMEHRLECVKAGQPLHIHRPAARAARLEGGDELVGDLSLDGGPQLLRPVGNLGACEAALSLGALLQIGPRITVRRDIPRTPDSARDEACQAWHPFARKARATAWPSPSPARPSRAARACRC